MTDAQPSAKPRRRKRRRLLWVALFLLLIAAAAVGAVHYVLHHTDTPRSVLVGILRDTTGLDVSIDEVDTGWVGPTTLTGVTVRLPGEDEPLFAAPTVVADHAALLMIIATGDPALADVQIIDPVITLRQDAAGRWNADRAAALVAARSGPDEGGPPTLPPSIHASNATVAIHPADGPPHTIQAIRFVGTAHTPAVYDIDATVGTPKESDGAPIASVAGRLDFGSPARHTLRIDVRDAHALAGPFIADAPAPIALDASWSATVTSGKLDGTLIIARAVVGEHTAAGNVELTTDGESVTVGPRGLHVELATEGGGKESITIGDGWATYADSAIEVRRLEVAARDTRARIAGRYNIEDRTGEADMSWTGAWPDPQITHQGTAHVATRPTTPGSLIVTIDASTRGVTPWGRWDTKFNASAEGSTDGEDGPKIDWRIAVDDGKWIRESEPPVAFGGLAAWGKVDGPLVVLDDVSLANALGELRAGATYDTQTRVWEADVAADGLRPPGAEAVGPIDATVVAHGDAERVILDAFEVSAAGIDVSGDGVYTAAARTPIDLRLTIRREPIVEPIATAATAEAPAKPNNTDDSNGDAPPPAAESVADGHTPATETPPALPTTGEDAPSVVWDAGATWIGRVTGTTDPLHILADGEAKLTRIIFNGQSVEDLSTTVTAEVFEDRALVNVAAVDTMDGTIAATATYRFGDATAGVAVDAASLSLGRIARLVNPSLDMDAVVGGEITVVLPRTDPSALRVEGEWSVDGFVMGPVQIDRMTGRLSTRRDGLLVLNPLRMRRGEGSAVGRAVINLRRGRSVRAELTGDEWPLDDGGTRPPMNVSGRIGVDVDLIEGRTVGDFDVVAAVDVGHTEWAKVKLLGDLTPQRVAVAELHADALGGEATGRMVVDLVDWTRSEGAIEWSGIDPGTLRKWTSEVDAIAGTVNGEVRFGPAVDERAPEPMRIDFLLRPTDALTYRNVPIESASVTGYVGPKRAVIDQSLIEIADGELRVWSTLTSRDQGVFAHVRIDFDRLDTDRLRMALPGQAEEEPIPGRLNGTGGLIGPIDDPSRWSGSGTVRIADSNLQGTDIVGGIFSLMGASPQEPTGYGRADWRIDGRKLIVSRFAYFNRGTQAIARITIDDLTTGAQSKMSGGAVGVLRPLKDADFPLAEDLDRLINAFQARWTRVLISGTLADPDVVPAKLEGVQTFLRSLGGDADAEQDD